MLVKLLLPFVFSATVLVGAVSQAGTPCDFTAFVSERDPKGLNVRSEPSLKGKILGTLPPPLKEKDGNLEARVEVLVTETQGGWFKIKNAKDNEALIEAVEGKPRPLFKGEGWVSGTKLTIKSMASKSYSEASVKSKLVSSNENGASFDSDADLDSFHLLSCKADWVEVQDKRLKKKNRYWLNKICGLQETSCSPGE